MRPSVLARLARFAPLLVAVAPSCRRRAPETAPTVARDSSLAILREASGVVRDGSQLLLVGDDTPDAYFAYALPQLSPPTGSGPLLGLYTANDRVTARPLPHSLALDLEGIALLSSGQPVLLSERLRALLGPEGEILVQYPARFTELGNRGLEGVAVRRESDSTASVAALWEGGFPERDKLPLHLDTPHGLAEESMKPVVCVHTLSIGGKRAKLPLEPCRNGSSLVQLDVPIPPDSLQRFRAPDLVWLPSGDGFLVLLSSQNATTAARVEFKYKWLQKFDLQGHRIGPALNLCGLLPEPVRGGATGNVEGMGWFDSGKSIVLVNDSKGPPTITILSIEAPWPSTTSGDICPS